MEEKAGGAALSRPTWLGNEEGGQAWLDIGFSITPGDPVRQKQSDQEKEVWTFGKRLLAS
jgi:hypothetical protein